MKTKSYIKGHVNLVLYNNNIHNMHNIRVLRMPIPLLTALPSPLSAVQR